VLGEFGVVALILPVIRGVRFNSDVEAEAYLLAESGGWDEAALAGVLSELAGCDGGLDGLGWDRDDLERLLAGLSRQHEWEVADFNTKEERKTAKLREEIDKRLAEQHRYEREVLASQARLSSSAGSSRGIIGGR
jgi:hypothetical protein